MSGHRIMVLSRRGFMTLVARGSALWGGRALAGDADPRVDRGIGGTGAAPIDPDDVLGQDRGIGGTGVIGTIQRFGSIVVNGLRIGFPPEVAVTIDGRPATAGELRVGHVVRVLARHQQGALATVAIAAESEVVGPLDAVGEGTIEVLGQRIVVPRGVTTPRPRAGRYVAVSGLRRLDGTVVASLVELRPRRAARLRGPVEVGADGQPAVGGLRVQGLSPSLIGRRVALVGTRRGGAFVLSAVTIEPEVPFAAAEQLSIEAYVARAPDGLRLGSGLGMSAAPSVMAEIGDDGPARAVVTAEPNGVGRLDAVSVQVERESRGAGRDMGQPSGPGTQGGGPEPGIGGPRGAGPEGGISGGMGPSGSGGAPGRNGASGGGPGGPGGPGH